jgi:PTS system mannitol-specific IIA component
MKQLSMENIVLNKKVLDKKGAIDLVGNILVEANSITKAYVDYMHKRDEMVSVYIGNGVAIPHGTHESTQHILKTDISVAVLDEEVYFNDNPVRVVIGIAALNDEHLDIIQNIAIVCSDMDNMEKIYNATTQKEICDIFLGGM